MPPTMRSDHHAGRSWRKKGETPVVETTGARHGMSGWVCPDNQCRRGENLLPGNLIAKL
jgi:hypothetical protein